MRKYLINLVKFLCFTAVFYVVAIIVIGITFPDFARNNLLYVRGGNGYMYDRMHELNRLKPNTDLLFLGSSRAYRGFDVRLFHAAGIHSFNLGSSNQTPIQTKVLLDRYLDKINPEKIVFEVNPDIFSNDGTESAIDILSNDKIDYHYFLMALEINNIKVYNTLLFSYFSQVLGIDPDIKAIDLNRQKYISGGYVESEGQNFVEKNMEYTCRLNTKQLSAFSKIIAMLQRRNISVYLVQAPVCGKLYNSCAENEKFDSLMMKNGMYINYNKEMSLIDSLHFNDGQHLNQTGVDLFNEKILQLVH